jgi:hypothetical protein
MSDPDDVMFSPSVKAEQARLGSRAMFEGREWKTEITDDLHQFLGVIDTFFFLLCDGQRRRPTLYPASRRTAGFPEDHR